MAKSAGFRTIASHKPASLIMGMGEMADRVRNHPWHETPLGPIDQWPATLISVVNLALSSPTAAAVYWGQEFIFIGNDESVRMIGPRDSLGLCARELWGAHWADIEHRLQAVLTQGASFSGESVPFKFIRTNKSDEVFLNYSLSPIYHQGSVAGVYGILEETTNSVVMMRELAESNERLRMALSAGSLGVWDWHIQTGLVYSDENTARLYGIDPHAALAGTSSLLYEKMLHPDDVVILTDAIMDCIMTGKQYSIEYRVRRPDDSYGWIQSMGRCVYDEQGHACRVTGLKTDITDLKNTRKLANSALSQQNLLPLDESEKLPRSIQAFLEGTIYSMTDKPEEIRLKLVSTDTATQIIVRVASDDLGKIIGKQGRTMRSVRTLLHTISHAFDHRYSIDIEAK